MKILIAEDEISTAKALKVILEKSKFSVDIVHNGNDAWNYIQALEKKYAKMAEKFEE